MPPRSLDDDAYDFDDRFEDDDATFSPLIPIAIFLALLVFCLGFCLQWLWKRCCKHKRSYTRHTNNANRRHKTWWLSDGLTTPVNLTTGGGERSFFPDHYAPATDVRDSMRAFGHTDLHLNDIYEAVRQKKADAGRLERNHPVRSALDRITLNYAAAVFAYTEEDDDPDRSLYRLLNMACRAQADPEQVRALDRYRDYLKHLLEGTAALPPRPGWAYRGIDRRLEERDGYEIGSTITWHNFSSCSLSQLVPLRFIEGFVEDEDDAEDWSTQHDLSGTIFALNLSTGRDVSSLSSYPEEEEVLLMPNKHLTVRRRLMSEAEKHAVLDHPAIRRLEMHDINVFVLEEAGADASEVELL